MPRRARFCPAGYPVHLIQRGNNRQAIFTCDADMAAYANWLTEGAGRFGVAVHGWVFMTNHVHLVATPGHDDSLSQLMQFLGRLYVRHFNYKYTRSGTLFEGRFKTSIVEEDHYLLTCLRYIELNPVRAGLVRHPGDYHWSSFGAHACGTKPRLWSPHGRYLTLGRNGKQRRQAWRALINETLDMRVMAKVRHCANTGLVLGTQTFREQVRQLRN
ncbi:transposase [Elongatibacter sediminis]|uniref:Transposase n=1 Tax=Elongatibacter sediminis TaxID=3119006 RepID=A0AAW9R6R8_9GAMM